MADCHLGAWRVPELQQLNFDSFRMAVDTCIKEKVKFVIIAGDLFDNTYPPIEVLKETFSEFKKLKDFNIPCYIIQGSHDFSASGKSFLDVLEKAGFCKNIVDYQEKDDFIYLNPYVDQGIALYGYSGKKSGLEVQDLKRVRIQDSHLFKILVLHTTLTEARGTLPIDSVGLNELPKVDYYALGHLHNGFKTGNCVYPGPIFPNSFQELEDLKYGSFYIIDESSNLISCRKIDLKIKEVETITLEINNGLTATEKITNELKSKEIKGKIILLRLEGLLSFGKISDIKFAEIEKVAKEKGVFVLLRNTSGLSTVEENISIDVKDMTSLEEEIVNKYTIENSSKFNNLVEKLMAFLEIEKLEDEKNLGFETRLFEETKKLLGL